MFLKTSYFLKDWLSSEMLHFNGGEFLNTSFIEHIFINVYLPNIVPNIENKV